jgi:hypothetical protein
MIHGFVRMCESVGMALRIPMKPAMHSNWNPATDSETKPAGVPI